MTVAALRRLLDEIDTQGGPEAARSWHLHLPNDERTPQPMATAPAHPIASLTLPTPPVTAAAKVELSVGQLLKWGDDHQDPDIRDQAARARVLLTGLRRRHTADQELAAITTEAEQLEQRLAALRAREAELAPSKKAKGKRKPTDYPAAEVRTWAKEQGIACPPVGRVPKAVVEAWRKATTPAP